MLLYIMSGKGSVILLAKPIEEGCCYKTQGNAIHVVVYLNAISETHTCGRCNLLTHNSWVRYHLTSLRMAVIKKTRGKCVKVMEERKLLGTIGGTVN